MAERSKYLVKKITTHSKRCKQCDGTGQVTDNGRCRKCIDCDKGVTFYLHETEIDLIEALKELGLIKDLNELRTRF
jgi:recombinational DNA repair protein RecR